MWTRVLRSKVEHDKNKRSKRHADAVTTESGDQMHRDYIPPWFDRYVEYKFNLLDRTGTSISGVVDEITDCFHSSLSRDTSVPRGIMLWDGVCQSVSHTKYIETAEPVIASPMWRCVAAR